MTNQPEEMEKCRAYAPHCDSCVLHAPSECVYCDKYPDWQHYREVAEINFTGHHDPDKVTCPSEQRRPLSAINRWYGNVAMTADQVGVVDRVWERFMERFNCPEGHGRALAKATPANKRLLNWWRRVRGLSIGRTGGSSSPLGRKTAMEGDCTKALERIAYAAVVGAQKDPRPIDLDWMRIWQIACRALGLEATPAEWARELTQGPHLREEEALRHER